MKKRSLTDPKLPLSEADFDALKAARLTGKLKWSDFPEKLKKAYLVYEQQRQSA